MEVTWKIPGGVQAVSVYASLTSPYLTIPSFNLTYLGTSNCSGVSPSFDPIVLSLINANSSIFTGGIANGTALISSITKLNQICQFILTFIGTGSNDLELDVVVIHNPCRDIWYVYGSVLANWSIANFTMATVTLALLGI